MKEAAEFVQTLLHAATNTHILHWQTKSYAEQAASMGKPTAYRAVANANGANQLAIIIPCHRIIASDGTLGGYGGGLSVKQWLLTHEQSLLNLH